MKVRERGREKGGNQVEGRMGSSVSRREETRWREKGEGQGERERREGRQRGRKRRGGRQSGTDQKKGKAEKIRKKGK